MSRTSRYSVVVFVLVIVPSLIAQQSITLSTPKGDIRFDDVRVSRPLLHRITGQATNLTTVDIDSLEVSVDLKDRGGLSVSCATDTCKVYLLNLQRQTSVKFDELLSIPLGESNDLNVIGLSIISAIYRPRYRFTLVAPSRSSSLGYNDKRFSFQFAIGLSQIDFELTNNTSAPLKIDWNSTSYVDVAKNAHRVFHSGIRYPERLQPQVASVIPPGAKIKDMIVSVDHVHYSESLGWSVNPLLPSGVDLVKRSAIDLKELMGAKFGVFFTVEIDGKPETINVQFEISQVDF